MTRILHELRTRQQTRQQIALTPRLQQSVRLLQMSTLDFSREVAQAISENPFLEEVEEQEDAKSSAASASYDPEDSSLRTLDATEGVSTTAVNEQKLDSDDSTANDAWESAEQLSPGPEEANGWSGDYPTRSQREPSDTDVGQWASASTTLQEMLYRNLCGYALSEREMLFIVYIIEALDDDGYLRTPFNELADSDDFSPPAQPREWEIALALVQQLAKPGLAARDLNECLRLQLKALPEDTPERTTALAILDVGLEAVARSDYDGLAQKTGSSHEDVRAACMKIRDLDPRPGSHFVAVNPGNFIVPDVVVYKVGQIWIAASNHEAFPRARLNTAYAELFRQARYAERGPMSQALQEARWLIRSLEQRNSTILRVAQSIVARQQTYFDYGNVALRPLMLSDIAEELDMHESTISRATSNKYMATPKGVVEFKHFFSRELATRTGGTLSAVAVRAQIQEMIAQEDPREPLSDVTLAQRLGTEGIVVARRTVSKYRAQLKIPAAESRRRPD